MPYEGTDTPKGKSIFDNTEVASITTMRYYRSKETRFEMKPHLDFLIKQMSRDKVPQTLVKDLISDQALEDLRNMSKMLDPEELKIAKEKFYKKYMELPTHKFRDFFAITVVATQIRQDEACAKSDRYEKGSVDNIEKGCSGTVGGTSSYFRKQKEDAAADGKLSIEIMGRENNAEIKKVEPPEETKDYLEQIIATLLNAANENTRAIVDAAGMCKSQDGTPETIVVELWKQLQQSATIKGIEGIVYYGKDGVKRVYRGPDKDPIPCHTGLELAALEERKYFSFYGQKNTRGSDIKQANGAHSLVTLDENVSNSDAKQAILRFRNLVNRDSSQTFSFAVMPEFERVLQETLNTDKTKTLAQKQKELAIFEKALNETDYKNIVIIPEVEVDPLDANFVKKSDQEKLEYLQLKLKDSIQATKRSIEILNKYKAPSLDGMRTKEISNFLRIQEKNIEERGALVVFRKEMKAHIKQAASHLENSILSQLGKDLTKEQQDAYQKFLTERADVVNFVEYSIRTLYKKYGTETVNEKRDEFIKKEKEKALKKLDDIFKVAETFAAAVKVNLNVKRDFYKEHIDRSVDLFKSRFGVDTPVQTTHVDANGQAIAQAQAQAQAQAEAVSQAEKLAEAEVTVLERDGVCDVLMVDDQHMVVDLSFVNNISSLDKVAGSLIENLIRPDLRSNFYLSPGMTNYGRLASHFVIKNGDEMVFVTQEEADEFKKQQTSYPGVILFDARQRVPQDDRERQAISAVLRENGVPVGVANTAALRGVSLHNVSTEQLLPKLSYRPQNGFENIFTQGHFGVSNNLKFSIEFFKEGSPHPITFEIKGNLFSKKVEIPNTCKTFNEEFKKQFDIANNKNKLQQVYDAIEFRCGGFKLEMDKLEAKKKALEVLNKKDSEEIANFKAFKLDDNMKNGLLERDSGMGFESRLNKIGAEAIQHADKIVALQNELKSNPTIDNLNRLEKLFDELISKGIIKVAKSIQITQDLLFDRNYWDRYFLNAYPMPILEKVYGRIVYSVHGASPSGASACTRKDCRQMFAQTIPEVINAVDHLNSIIKSIKEREVEKLKIHKEIKELEEKAGDLFVALKTAKDLLIEQETIEEGLAKEGMIYSSNTFFDQFSLNSSMELGKHYRGEFETTLPDYRHVIEDMEKYRKTLKHFTAKESEEVQKNKEFLKQVFKFAQEVTDRRDEITTI